MWQRMDHETPWTEITEKEARNRLHGTYPDVHEVLEAMIDQPEMIVQTPSASFRWIDDPEGD